MVKLSKIQRRPIYIAWALYVVSLTLPAIMTVRPTLFGYEAAISGPLGVLVWNFAWLANPLFVLASASYLQSGFRGAFVMSVVATGLALTSYTFKAYPTGGGDFAVTGLGVGFYVWL